MSECIEDTELEQYKRLVAPFDGVITARNIEGSGHRLFADRRCRGIPHALSQPDRVRRSHGRFRALRLPKSVRRASNTLVYYVEDALYSVPYRVEAPWPARPEQPVRFELLRLQE